MLNLSKLSATLSRRCLNSVYRNDLIINKRLNIIRYSSQNSPDIKEHATQTIMKKMKTSSLEKWMLVRMKKYPSISEVPELIGQGQVELARSKLRIYLSTAMIFITLVGSLIMARIGKKESDAGYSITQMNLDWHKKEREAYEKENK